MSSGSNRGRWLLLACVLSVSLNASPALAEDDQKPAPSAEETSEQDRDTARKLSLEALDLMENRRWQEAHMKLEEAYSLFRAPTVGVLSARAMEKVGDLLGARDRYREASAVSIDDESPKPFRKAVREAKREADRLTSELPHLVVRVEAEEKQRVAVEVDGKPLAQEKWGQPTPVNPGQHSVVARLGSRTVTQEITLAKRETSQVALAVMGAPPATPPPAPAAEPAQPAPRGNTIAWVSLGVGAAGLATGIVAGAVMMNAKGDLDRECRATCPPDQRNNLTKFRNARSVSFVGYSVGLLGLGLGVALLVENSGADQSPVVAIGNGEASLGYWGRF